MIARRLALTNEEWSEKNCLILGKLMHHELYQSAKTIYCYVSYKHEVDTWPLLAFSIAIGKRVAVPKVTKEGIRFFYIHSLEELKPGYQGIYEPPAEEEADDENALMIMPVVAYDSENHRLGYGGGFYDRYLKEHTGHRTVGLAYEFQQVKSVPAEETDVLPEMIITDRKEG